MCVLRLCRSFFVALLLAAPAVAAAQVPIGGEILVNTSTADDQTLGDVAMDTAGGFVVVWTDSYIYQHDPGFPFFGRRSRGVYGRGFSASGRPYGPQFEVVTGTTLRAEAGSVAADGHGSFVVMWETAASIDARRFAPDGTPARPPVRVSGTADGWMTDLAADPSGAFVVAWQQGPYHGEADVRGRRFDAADAPAGGPFEVAALTRYTRSYPAIAADASGGFVVAWNPNPYSSAGQSTERRILARLFDASTAPQTPPLVVSTYEGRRPAVARRADGGFLVAWVQGRYHDHPGVFARLFDTAGNALGGEFQVQASSTKRFYGVSVAADTDGSFVVVWDEGEPFVFDRPQPHRLDIFARRFDTAGAPLTTPFRVNTYTTYVNDRYPEVSSDGQGHFVLAWTRWFGGGFAPDVMARRFGPDRLFADGFESGGLSAWSASAGGSDLLVTPEAAMGSSSAWGCKGT